MRKPRQDWSHLGVNFEILDEHPHLFYIRVPPPPPPPDSDTTLGCARLSVCGDYRKSGQAKKRQRVGKIKNFTDPCCVSLACFLIDCLQSVFLSNMGRERRELRAKRDCDEKRLGRDRVCHARQGVSRTNQLLRCWADGGF